jgi:hypothetical protein
VLTLAHACRALRTPMRYVQSGGHARLYDGMDQVARWPADIGRFLSL